MTSNIKILTAVLVLQVGLFAYLATKRDDLAVFDKTEKFVTWKEDAVNRIEVTDREGQTVTLAKENNVWTLPGKDSFRANPEKVNKVIEVVTTSDRGWPSGKTTIAAKQFHVVDDNFERKLTFKNGDEVLSTLYLGNSPGFRKVYARVDGQDNTYSLVFNTYEVPTTDVDWLDKTVLHLDKAELNEISMNGFKIASEGGQFNVANLSEGKTTNRAKVDTLVRTVTKPDFEDLLPTNAFSTDTLVEYHLMTTQGEKRTHSFYKLDEGQDKAKSDTEQKDPEYVALTASNHPKKVFKVRYSRIKSIIGLTKSDLETDDDAKKNPSDGGMSQSATPDTALETSTN